MSLKRESVIAFLPDNSEFSGHLFTRERDNSIMGFIPAFLGRAVDVPAGTVFLPFRPLEMFVVANRETALLDPNSRILDVPIFAMKPGEQN